MAMHTTAARSRTGPSADRQPASADATSRATWSDHQSLSALHSPEWNFVRVPVARQPLPMRSKLQIGAVVDPLEREADRAAE